MSWKRRLAAWLFRKEHERLEAAFSDITEARWDLTLREKALVGSTNALEQASLELSNVPVSAKTQQMAASVRFADAEADALRAQVKALEEDRALIAKALNLGPDEPLEGYLMALRRAHDAAEDAQRLKDEVNEAKGLRQMKQLMATCLDDAQLMAYRAALQKSMGTQIYDEDLEREWQRRAMKEDGL